VSILIVITSKSPADLVWILYISSKSLFPESYQTSDLSICIFKYHKENIRKYSSPELENITVSVATFSCNTLAVKNYFDSGAFILLWIIPEVQRPFLSGLEFRNTFGGLGPFIFIILFETNNFHTAAALVPCFDSELQETLSPELKLRTLFRSVYFLLSFRYSFHYYSCLKK
jgi:hypothetical protein